VSRASPCTFNIGIPLVRTLLFFLNLAEISIFPTKAGAFFPDCLPAPVSQVLIFIPHRQSLSVRSPCVPCGKILNHKISQRAQRGKWTIIDGVRYITPQVSD
jgi:hypothetical protein